MNNIFKSFDREISWNTKFYVLLAFGMLLFGYLSGRANIGMLSGALLALLVLMILDFYLILSKKDPKTWRSIQVVLIAEIVLIVLVGFVR